MTNKTVREIIRETCESNDCPEVVDLVWFEWSNRMTATMGSVRGINLKGYQVKLSTKLFARASKDEQRDTVIHEVCHAIDDYLNQRGDNTRGGLEDRHASCWSGTMQVTQRKYRRASEAILLYLPQQML